jgi:hypothetical protein
MSHKTLTVFALVGALSFPAHPGIAQEAPSLHQGQWPIQNGIKRQLTRERSIDCTMSLCQKALVRRTIPESRECANSTGICDPIKRLTPGFWPGPRAHCRRSMITT